MRENQRYTDISKCEFYVKKVKFLGMSITTEEIKIDPIKIEAIRQRKTTETLTEVLGFLGIIGHYRRFIKTTFQSLYH